MNNAYVNFIFGKLGSGVFLIYLTITIYFMMFGGLNDAILWLRLSEAYITYNAASYLIADEKSLSLPSNSSHRGINFFNWLLNNFFSRKVFVLGLSLIIVTHNQMNMAQLFEIGIFMLGGRMVEKFSRNVQKEMTAEKKAVGKRIVVNVDDEEGDA